MEQLKYQLLHSKNAIKENELGIYLVFLVHVIFQNNQIALLLEGTFFIQVISMKRLTEFLNIL